MPKFKKEVDKSLITQNYYVPPDQRGYTEYSPHRKSSEQSRGARVYTLSEIMRYNGRTMDGNRLSVPLDSPYFNLSPQERNAIFQVCSPVFGIVTSRMNRLAGLDFEITADKKIEDEKKESFDNAYNVINELSGITDLATLVTIAKLKQFLISNLPGLRVDLTNYSSSLLRWKRKIQNINQKHADEIKEFFLHPNGAESWTDFVKQWVCDLMIHGTSAIYKNINNDTNALSSIHHLNGGSVFMVRTPYVSELEAYIQIVDYDFQIFYENEIVYSKYIPVSWRSYSYVPLEALVNKIAETLLFDKLMADRADGTQLPEKMVVVTDDNKVFDANNLELPLPEGEQRRIEEKLNQKVRGGVVTFSGNSIEVIDLSKENTMDIQNIRQKDIREEVALVFNMSNMEVNLTGSGDTSGRATSEVQMEIEQGKGISPIIKTIESKINSEILPFIKNSAGYSFNFQLQSSKDKQLDYFIKKKQSGLYSVNEIRVTDLNEMPFKSERYNEPEPKQPQGNDASNPFFVKNGN